MAPTRVQVRCILKLGGVGMNALDGGDQTHLSRGPEQGYSGKCLDDISEQTLRDDPVQEARRKQLETEYSGPSGFGRSAPDRRRPSRQGSHRSACDGWMSAMAMTSRRNTGPGL